MSPKSPNLKIKHSTDVREDRIPILSKKSNCCKSCMTESKKSPPDPCMSLLEMNCNVPDIYEKSNRPMSGRTEFRFCQRIMIDANHVWQSEKESSRSVHEWVYWKWTATFLIYTKRIIERCPGGQNSDSVKEQWLMQIMYDRVEKESSRSVQVRTCYGKQELYKNQLH